jgi:hypothetical protein
LVVVKYDTFIAAKGGVARHWSRRRRRFGCVDSDTRRDRRRGRKQHFVGSKGRIDVRFLMTDLSLARTAIEVVAVAGNFEHASPPPRGEHDFLGLDAAAPGACASMVQVKSSWPGLNVSAMPSDDDVGPC